MPDVRITGLKEFIEEEMRTRNMNASQFADFVGVSHTTIGRAIDPRNPTTPSPEFLVKLARATKINLSTLIARIMPEAEHSEVDSKALLMAERIAQLPPDKQAVLDELILGFLLKAVEQSR